MAQIKYITSAAFRNTFFDDTGLPLIDGFLYSYKDSDHSCLKAVYKTNEIVSPATEPVAYANPIELTSGGSVPVPGPIFFADDEPYFLELRDVNDDIIDTQDSWPPTTDGPTPPADEIDVTNFIANSDFTEVIKHRFEGAELGISPVKISFPEWYFIRSNTNATMDVRFEKFLLGQTDVPNDPYGYIKHETTVVNGGGETFKDIYFVIKDVRSFENTQISFAFYGRSDQSNTIEIIANQNFGASGSASVETNLGSFPLTNDWVQYLSTELIPSIAGKTIDPERGQLEIKFRMPLNVVCEVELTHVQLNKGDDLLEYQYLPEQYANGKSLSIETPARPTDLFYDIDGTPIGYDWKSMYTTDQGIVWVPGEAPAGAQLLWPTEDAPNYWLSACQDTTDADHNFAITAAYPRLFAILGEDYGKRYTSSTIVTDTVTVTNLEDGVVVDAIDVNSGFTINVTQQGTASLPEIFTVQCLAASALTEGTYFTLSSINPIGPVTNNFAIYIRKNNSGLPPIGLGATRLIQLDIDSTDTADDVALKLDAIMNPLSFAIVEWNGYFPRGWANESTRDPDRATRTDRGDGTVGDNVGTRQPGEIKSHQHGIPFVTSVQNLSGGTGSQGVFTGADDITRATGGNETRPVNKYTHFIIKY